MFCNGAMVAGSIEPESSVVLTFSSLRWSGVDGGPGVGDDVGGDAGLRQSDTDQTVARDDLDQLVFGPAVGPLGAHRHHHEPVLLVGILHPDLDVVGQIEPELREHLAWRTDQTSAVVGGAIPLR